MKAKDTLARFFEKQEKANKILGLKKEHFDFKLEEKREKNEERKVKIKEAKQQFLRKLESHAN